MKDGKEKCFDDYFFDIQIIVDASGSMGKNFKPVMKVRTSLKVTTYMGRKSVGIQCVRRYLCYSKKYSAVAPLCLIVK